MIDPSLQLQIPPEWEAQVDQARLERAIRTTLEREGVEESPSLSFVLVGDEEMARLNEAYLAHEGTTDVLTFPYEDGGVEEEMGSYLGDIIVCYDQAARQGAEEGHSAQHELELLAVHGTLHLLGYEDGTPADRRVMWAQQRAVMEQLGLGGVAPGEEA